MGDYQKLDVWKLARILARKVYLVTRHFPPDERFGLTSQTRRAAVSIMSNIAEGRGLLAPLREAVAILRSKL
jgi:four helix bundle protein